MTRGNSGCGLKTHKSHIEHQTHIISQCAYDSYTHSSSSWVRELKKDVPTRGFFGYLCFCCWKKPQVLVTVHLEEAHDLKKQDLTGAGEEGEGGGGADRGKRGGGEEEGEVDEEGGREERKRRQEEGWLHQ